MIVLAGLAAAGVAAGVWLVVSGLRPAQQATGQGQADGVDRLRRTLAHRFHGVDARRAGAAACGALAAAVLVRWPVGIAAGALAGWFVPLPGQQAARQRAEGRTEAIAHWCEMLRDAAGTPRGIEGILVATAASAPASIRPEVCRMAERLQDKPLDEALDGLAEDLAHPIGDLVVTALHVAATAGSRRVAAVLSNLAAAAHQEAAMRQRVDVARAKPRSTMRLVALIVTGFVAGLVLLARDYLAPYSTPAGQLVLVGIGFYWALAGWWMARMGRIPETGRFLAPASVVVSDEPRCAGWDRGRGRALVAVVRAGTGPGTAGGGACPARSTSSI